MGLLPQAPLSLSERPTQTPINKTVPELSVEGGEDVAADPDQVECIELPINEFPAVLFVDDCPSS